MVESDADRLAFLADFGEAVAWTVGAGPAVPLLGLFDNGSHSQARYAEELPVLVTAATLTVRSIDLPLGAAAGDSVTVRDIPYLAKALTADATGLTLVSLELDFGS